MSEQAERFAAAVLEIALGAPVPRGQLCYFGVQFGLLVEVGHDGLGGTAYRLTEDGEALKKRVERDIAREKIIKLQEQIRKLEGVANG